MRIQGTYRFAAPRERVWDALQDPQTLASTLPGVRRLEVVGADRYALSIQVGVGAVRGAFDGTFAVEDKREPDSCTLRGSARGSAGSAEATARVRLAAADGQGTLLEYEGDAKVTGALAGVGQRMLAAAARKNTEAFLAAVNRALTEPAAPAVPAGAAAPPAMAAPTGRVFVPPAPPTVGGDLRSFAQGLVAGALIALAGVAVGRWSRRHPA